MEDNVVGIGDLGSAQRDALLTDYGYCSERHQAAIRRFAHKLAELDHPSTSGTILQFKAVTVTI